MIDRDELWCWDHDILVSSIKKDDPVESIIMIKLNQECRVAILMGIGVCFLYTVLLTGDIIFALTA